MYVFQTNLIQVMNKETKQEEFSALEAELRALILPQDGLISNMANFCAALYNRFDFLWVGFYIIDEDQLRLGPFQGPVACTRIAKGKGVCGSAWSLKETVVANDVHNFPGHITCSADSNSEIVLPLLVDNEVKGVLDIDSTAFGYFDEIDQECLENIVKWFASVVY